MLFLFRSFSLKYVFSGLLFSLLTLFHGMLYSLLPSSLPDLLTLLLSLDLFIISFPRVLFKCGFVLPRSLDCLIGVRWFNINLNSSLH